MDENKEEKRGLSDLVKDLTSSGLAALFMTEDSIRSYLKEKKLPKEIAGVLLELATRKKDDFYGVLAKEFGRMLSKIDLTAEISRFLENHRIQLEAKLSFEPKKGNSNEKS